MPLDPSTAFVCYSHEDREFVLRLANDLRAKGAKVWVDKLDIRVAHPWDTEVENAVDQCSRMLVILSPDAVASEKVKNEFMAAIDEDKEVIPVFFRECKIPLQLRRLQYADFRADYSVGLEELFVTLSGDLETTPPEAPSRKTVINAPQFTDPKLEGWYRRAKAGDSNAMWYVGAGYESGSGVVVDFRQAASWYRKAAEAGSEAGMIGLGLLYEQGLGVARDYGEAVSWFRKAAEAGNGNGMTQLGFMYETGHGVERDQQQAISWYRKGAALGDPAAKDGLKRLGQNP